MAAPDFQAAMDKLVTLDTLQNMGEAMAAAVLADEFVFEFVPRAHRYMHENVIAYINNSPALVEATGEAINKGLIGIGKMNQYTGKGVQYVGKGIKYGLPSVLELLVGMT